VGVFRADAFSLINKLQNNANNKFCTHHSTAEYHFFDFSQAHKLRLQASRLRLQSYKHDRLFESAHAHCQRTKNGFQDDTGRDKARDRLAVLPHSQGGADEGVASGTMSKAKCATMYKAKCTTTQGKVCNDVQGKVRTDVQGKVHKYTDGKVRKGAQGKVCKDAQGKVCKDASARRLP
jgi:hypothetical protein